MSMIGRKSAAGLLCALAGSALATEEAPTLAGCAAIPDERLRLACFDRLAAHVPRPADPTPVAAVAPLQAATASIATDTPGKASGQLSLADHWELEDQYKRGTFHFRQHRPNYLLLAYNRKPNSAPYRPFAELTEGDVDLSRAEAQFQIGFKIKALQNIVGSKSDLWFGYTQKSFWQAGNQEASSPFRENNYQPEFMLVTPTDFRFLGMKVRFLNFGLSHQSNGQVSTLSRSWNRAYLQAGMEKGNFTLLARVWKRLPEDAAEDDNPDIIDYAGRGDVYATYRINGHELSMLARRNFETDRGALQLGWAFPLSGSLKGYVRAFSGYGQSLIDYNYSQTSIGVGFLVNY